MFSAVYSKSAEKWMHYTSNSGIADNFVTSISEDAGQNIWAGTWKGICKLEKGSSKWKVFNRDNGLVGDRITSIVCNNNVWAGILALSGRGGVSMISDKGEIKNITMDQGLLSEAVTSLAIDSMGNIWIGTWNKGIAVFDPLAWKVIQIHDKSNGLPADDIVDLFAQGNRVWAGTKYSGLGLWENNKWTVFSEHTSGLRNNAVHAITETENDMWFGTWAGAFSINKNKDFTDFKNWHEYTDFMSRLADRFVRVIASDPKNRVWFGTDKGLSMFDGNTWLTYTSTCRRVTVYDDKNKKWYPQITPGPSLLSNTVLDIMIDSRFRLWVATDRGISCMTLSGESGE